MVIIFVHISSVRVRGGAGYVRHYLEPFPALAPITIIEEITKPLTLAARLFGNIFAGEVLVLVFGTLLSGVLTVILPIPDAILGVGLGLFVGGIQAFIFTILTVVYISVGTSTEAH